MANTQTILKVFISSPTDVAGEREAVLAAIDELNTTWSSDLGLRFEPVLWEKNSRPAAGKDSQQVINQQLSQDYDIFVGMMWKRFGTPTPRFGSGSEEEFERAYRRHKKDSESVSLLTYFKDEAVPPSEIETEQLDRINAFKKKLKSRGILYRSYKSLDEFQKLIRIHLSLEMQQWIKRGGYKLSAKEQVSQGNDKQEFAQRASRLNLKEYQQYSEQCRENVAALMVEHYAALDEYLNRLNTFNENEDVEKLVLAVVLADKSLCDRLEPILGGLLESIDELIEAWISEFTFELLNGTAKKSSSRELLRRLRGLSKVFRNQSLRSKNIQIPVEKVLLRIPRLAVTHKRLVNLFKSISSELNTAAKLLFEAAEALEKSMENTKIK